MPFPWSELEPGTEQQSVAVPCGGCEHLNGPPAPLVYPTWSNIFGLWLCPRCGNNLTLQLEVRAG